MPGPTDDDRARANSALLASVAKSLRSGKGNPPALPTLYPQTPWQTVTHPMGLLPLFFPTPPNPQPLLCHTHIHFRTHTHA